jgi:hypothetical protein
MYNGIRNRIVFRRPQERELGLGETTQKTARNGLPV